MSDRDNPVSTRQDRADAFWSNLDTILDESVTAIEGARQAVADAEDAAAPCDHPEWAVIRGPSGTHRYDAELAVVLACADCGHTRTHRFLAGGNDTDDR